MAALMVMGLAAGTQAAAVLTFDNLIDDGGTLTHEVGGPLVGTDILFDDLKAEGTAADGNYACLGCVLNFTTGNSTQEGPALWEFNGGGEIVLTGTIPLLGITEETVLLSGFWTGPNVATGLGSTLTFTGIGLDEKNPDLLAALGIDAEDFRLVESTISLGEANIEEDGSFTATVSDADLVNTALPEPGTTFLLVLGVAGLALSRRRF